MSLFPIPRTVLFSDGKALHTKLREIKDVPNVIGYPFYGVDKWNKAIFCEMKQDQATGHFFIVGALFIELSGWLTTDECESRL